MNNELRKVKLTEYLEQIETLSRKLYDLIEKMETTDILETLEKFRLKKSLRPGYSGKKELINWKHFFGDLKKKIHGYHGYNKIKNLESEASDNDDTLMNPCRQIIDEPSASVDVVEGIMGTSESIAHRSPVERSKYRIDQGVTLPPLPSEARISCNTERTEVDLYDGVTKNTDNYDEFQSLNDNRLVLESNDTTISKSILDNQNIHSLHDNVPPIEDSGITVNEDTLTNQCQVADQQPLSVDVVNAIIENRKSIEICSPTEKQKLNNDKILPQYPLEDGIICIAKNTDADAVDRNTKSTNPFDEFQSVNDNRLVMGRNGTTIPISIVDISLSVEEITMRIINNIFTEEKLRLSRYGPQFSNAACEMFFKIPVHYDLNPMRVSDIIEFVTLTWNVPEFVVAECIAKHCEGCSPDYPNK